MLTLCQAKPNVRHGFDGACYAPTLQRYLTGPLPGGGSPANGS